MNGFSEEFDSTFRILLATDLHLGAHENDGVRGQDSFVTFEEILKIGKDREVDFILLGGDLFDHNIPSTKCYNTCLSLLRKYCMGDKPISVSFDSNPEEIFKHCDHKIVNYLDPNLNISIPVYSIHGNHDDPSGFGRMSPMDTLSTSGLINYFGKWTDLNNIILKPILLSKGSSKIALYGLSNIRDERLYRLFASRNVQFEGTKDHASRFNILVLHQNRVERGPKNYVPEDQIPDFFNFVFWGHEHDCRVDPEENVSKGFVVCQPGSSVVTSLCEGEAIPKHVAILNVRGTSYNLEKIKLRTVRPYVFDTQKLSDWNLKLPPKNRSEAIQEYVEKYIRKVLLPKAREQLTGHPDQPTMPLVRLRLEFTEDYQQFNTVRFSQGFSEIIANASTTKHSEVVKLVKDTSVRNKRKQDFVPNLEGVADDIANEVSVEEIAERLLEEAEDPKNKLSVLLTRALTIGVKSYVEKEDKLALDHIVQAQISKVKAKLKTEGVNETNIKDKINELRESCTDRKEAVEDEVSDWAEGGIDIPEVRICGDPRLMKKSIHRRVGEDLRLGQEVMFEVDRLPVQAAEEVREYLASDKRGMTEPPAGSSSGRGLAGGSSDDSDWERPGATTVSPPKRGRGSRGGRGAGGVTRAATTRGRGRGRAAAKTNTTLSNTSMNITRYTSGSIRPRHDDDTSFASSPSKKAKVNYVELSDSD